MSLLQEVINEINSMETVIDRSRENLIKLRGIKETLLEEEELSSEQSKWLNRYLAMYR